MKSPGQKARLATVLAELKAEYLEKLPLKIEMLRQFTQVRDWHNLEEEYHKLKGTGKTYGFPEISTICQQLELMAQTPQGQIPEIFEKALTLLEKIHQSHLQNQPFDLDSDSFARSLLEQKLK